MPRPKTETATDRLVKLATAGQALGVGSQQAPALDPNKMMMMLAAQQQIPENIQPMLMQMYQDRPEVMQAMFPQLPLNQQQGAAGVPQLADIMAQLGEGAAQPTARVPVQPSAGSQYGPADALLDAQGNILGYATPGTDQLMDRYVPSAASVGNWTAGKAQVADFFKGLFDWTKPKFQTQPTPIQPQQ
jgi:hypothetical protein